MPEPLPQAVTLLVTLHGKGARNIDLTHETLTIGRKADNTPAIEDPAVSGHHARIVKIQAVFFLEDLKSTNGTAINGQTITRRQLRDEDLISIGQHRLSHLSTWIEQRYSEQRAMHPTDRRSQQGPDCCREN